MLIETTVSLGAWFQERVQEVTRRENLQTSERAQRYLVQLLANLGQGVQPQQDSLTLALASAHATENPDDRHQQYRRLGDSALCMKGLFVENIERRGIDTNYVVHVGETAYAAAYDTCLRLHGRGDAQVYRELAHGFDVFALIVDEVRESTSLRTPQDIVRLYDRWRKTGSKRIAQRLSDEGVFPQHVPGRTQH